MKTPIKRSESLKPLSRDHHHGLLLCWKIRFGIKNNIQENRIKKYADWFYEYHLIPHFDLEEQHIFPILDAENELTRKAISEHRRLRRLFESDAEIQKNLSLIEEELERHIRFEERILFNEIQRTATAQQLETIALIHKEDSFVDNLIDPFWEK
ncbi:MAG: cation-binding protein [Bacteroidetes bacterium HGW-Bacteroidetes-23]|nr:MAG: cation-binding protein [Bacteroidetes bacterium HGW-Bacteroidetes-23]